MRSRNVITAILLAIAPVLTLNAETRVSGDVQGRWTRNAAPYVATGQITLRDGDTLRIDPGVEVRFEGDYMFLIYGCLRAFGTYEDSIRFNPIPDGEGWGGLRFLEADSGSALDYCVITKGRALHGEGGDSLGMGGDIFISGGFVSIDHSRISLGSARLAGGGVAILRSAPVIRNCLIQGNQSNNYGGGVSITAGASPIFDNVKFVANLGLNRGGGGALLDATRPVFTGCIFQANQATSAETGLGGGLFIAEAGSAQIRKCEFLENVGTSGAGVYISGAQVNPLIEWCYFWGNATNAGSRVGGALYIRGQATPEIRYCRLVENNSNYGGGIYVKEPPRLNIHNTLFLRNAATRAGGAVGCAADCGDEPVKLNNCTFINNNVIGGEATARTAYARRPEGANPGSRILINSSIVIGQHPLFGDEGRIEVKYTDVIPAFDGVENFSLDPRFFAYDSTWFVLSGGSPCIDSGDTALVRDPDGTRADRGWLHFPRNAFDSIPEEPLSAELTTIDRVEVEFRFTNQTGVPIFVSALDRWNGADRAFFINASGITGDTLLKAVSFAGGNFYAAGTAEDQEPRIYSIDRNYNLLGSFPQPGGRGDEGYLDLASDGESLLYGISDDMIVEFTTSGEYGQEFRAPHAAGDAHSIAADFHYSGGFVDYYIGGDNGVVVRADAQMFEIGSTALGDTIIGLGMKGNERAIYALTQSDDGMAQLWLVHPDENNASLLYPIPLPEGYRPGGFDVTQSLNEGLGHLVGLAQTSGDEGDRIYAIELYTSWLVVHSSRHFLMPGEYAAWPVVFAGDQMPAGIYDGHFFLTVNGSGEGGEVQARMTSTQSDVKDDGGPVRTFILNPAYPNPFNGRTTISFAVPEAGFVGLTLTDATGRTLKRMSLGWTPPGERRVSLDASSLAGGVYYIRIATPSGSGVRAITLIK